MAKQIYCAPDLPFLDTIVWYLKQIGAHAIIAVGVTLILVLIAIVLDKFGVIKL